MDAERWRRARALFDLLVDAPSAGWEKRLAEACPEDAETRAEALALLRADLSITAGTGFADVAPEMIADLAERIHVEDAACTAVRTGLRLGPFRLVRQIGRGGMGAVWLGERVDGGFAQSVAIKLIRSGWDLDDTQRRFLAERQILAGLQHPNIAHLIDGGVTADGKPWLALEYIDGESVLEWCDRRRLGIAERLKLFLVVCDAVAHAHQRLVVHRDLKPSNILVGRDGTLKLLDFGIAKLLDQAGDATATRVFTPDYAAPEQIRGEPITTAVDVYALGLLLYELLTGRRPREARDDAKGAAELPRPSTTTLRDGKASDAEPLAARRGLAPGALRRRLRGDLDAIVMKALRVEPAQRYAGVGDFAADVERHLRDRPVRARRDGWSYRSGRFVRRHRWALAASAGGVLALAAGLGAALWQMREAAAQRDVALRESETARRTVDVLVGVFDAANPRTHPGVAVTPADLLAEGEREVRRKLGAQPEQRAALLEALGRARASLGTYEEALPLLREALALRIAGGDPLAEAGARLALVPVLSRQSHDEEALAEAEHAYELGRGQSRIAVELRATADLSAGIQLANLDRWEEAEARLRRSAQVRSQLFGIDSEAYHEVVQPWSFHLAAMGRAKEALTLLEPAWQALSARTEPGAPERRLLLDARGNALARAGRHVEAVAAQREALLIVERVYGADHPSYYTQLNNLGVALYHAGQAGEAVQAFERCMQWRAANPARENLRRPDLFLRGYALALDAAGRSADAIGVFDRIREQQRTLAGATSEDRARTLLMTARSQRRASRYDAADTSLADYFARYASDASASGTRMDGLIERSWLAVARGHASRDCEDAIEAAKLGETSPKPVDALRAQATLAACRIANGQRDLAKPLIERLPAKESLPTIPHHREPLDAALALWRGSRNGS
ncbi:serine/threonine-protein kinase [Dokdonella sp.]|uniref:serine/threonine-protein kinase n=1 Tax=Dokdonella sp. TaxID=2291710 RepID=UPI001AFD2F55|nr:serine/threonine-protein kinase [Dokdonella sp.]MBO9664542.1 serine/threonine protein kinase [Dokdonella sp.]